MTPEPGLDPLTESRYASGGSPRFTRSTVRANAASRSATDSTNGTPNSAANARSSSSLFDMAGQRIATGWDDDWCESHPYWGAEPDAE